MIKSGSIKNNYSNCHMLTRLNLDGSVKRPVHTEKEDNNRKRKIAIMNERIEKILTNIE